MLVFKTTMDAAVEAERKQCNDRIDWMVRSYGSALARTSALQVEMSAWVLNKAENIAPEQMAQMFYAQDDRWQAAFFNCMQAQVLAYHGALPPARSANEYVPSAGHPAGEGQWYHMAQHLTDAGFETIEAMFDHAKHHRDPDDEEAQAA